MRYLRDLQREAHRIFGICLWQDQYQQQQQRLAELVPQLHFSVQAWQECCQFPRAENLQQLQKDLDIYQTLLNFAQQHDLKLLKIVDAIDIRQISEAKAICTEIQQNRTRLIFNYDASIYQAELKQIEF